MAASSTASAAVGAAFVSSPQPAQAPAPADPPLSLLGLVRTHRAEFGFGALFLVVSNTCAAAVPQFIRGACNAIVAARVGAGTWLVIGIVIAAIAGALARIASRIYLFNAGRNIEYELRQRMLARLHVLGPAFFRRMTAGEVMSRATNDLGQVRLLLGFAGLNLVNTAIAYVANVPLMLWRSPPLTLAALAPFPLFVLIMRLFAGSMYRLSRGAQESLGQMSERAQQSLAGVRVVRAYGLEGSESRAFDRLSQRSLEANMALTRLRGAMQPIMGTATAVSSLAVVWMGSKLVLAHRATIGDILAFQGHLALIAWPTIALAYVFSIVQRGRASLARVSDLVNARPEVNDEHAVPLDTVAGALSVRHLSYSIGDRELLSDVSFELPAGGSLAIVGRTGSGKSTLASLLARMQPTPADTVYLDDRDITTLPVRQLRRSICMAQQEAFLFSTTIERNIAFAESDPDAPEAMARARNAASEAQILRETESMPDGLDTIVGERGVQLSGGQKQRVALARALLAQPRVLVLDDPLSAVDARTEVAILDAIERAARDRTLVLVTHRISAAARCSQVVVLDEGRVVERGTHASLLANGGFYARLAERQALEAELEAL